MAVEYGPDDLWPEHGKHYWRSALKSAREAGWFLHFIGAPHTFGQIRCPAGEHTATVDCTARGAEAYAKDAERDIRECRHGTNAKPGSKVEERREAAHNLLATAERLIATAREGLDCVEAGLVAYQELERLDLMLESAIVTIEQLAAAEDDEVDQAFLAVEALQADHDAAVDRAAEFDDALEVDDIDDVLTRAEVSTEAAGEVVAKIKRQGLAKPLKDRVANGVREIGELRVRLNRLQHGSDQA